MLLQGGCHAVAPTCTGSRAPSAVLGPRRGSGSRRTALRSLPADKAKDVTFKEAELKTKGALKSAEILEPGSYIAGPYSSGRVSPSMDGEPRCPGVMLDLEHFRVSHPELERKVLWYL